MKGGVFYWNWIVEDHHHAVTGIAFEGAAILDDEFADGRMVVSQKRHYVFGVGSPSGADAARGATVAVQMS